MFFAKHLAHVYPIISIALNLLVLECIYAAPSLSPEGLQPGAQ